MLTSTRDRQDNTEDMSLASMVTTKSELVRLEGVLEDIMEEVMGSQESAFATTSSEMKHLLVNFATN